MYDLLRDFTRTNLDGSRVFFTLEYEGDLIIEADGECVDLEGCVWCEPGDAVTLTHLLTEEEHRVLTSLASTVSKHLAYGRYERVARICRCFEWRGWTCRVVIDNIWIELC